MKATMDIPDELYRQVKAKSALEGRPVREVAVELFRNYVDGQHRKSHSDGRDDPRNDGCLLVDGEPAPPWFGMLNDAARVVRHHDLETIRESIALQLAQERGW